MSLDSQLKKAADFLIQNSDQMVRIVSHLDCDGICACAIIVKALIRKGIRHSITIVPQLEERIINQIANEEYGLAIFSDIGSGQLKFLKHVDKNIIILDHHRFHKTEIPSNIIHVNPGDYGIDGSKDVSGSGVAYKFAVTLEQRNTDLAWIAVIGALGDSQERKGFTGVNKTIMDAAVANGSLEVKKGLRMHGISKPLHKLLELSFDPFIPGVTGNYKGALNFLEELGIDSRKDGRYVTLEALSISDQERLAKGIIEKRSHEKDADDIYGNKYELAKEKGQLNDAREYCTALNACGRLGKSSVGVGSLLGDSSMKKEALDILLDFRKEIVSALHWVEKNEPIKADGAVIINAKDNIMPTMAGTICSMIARSKKYPDGTIVMLISRAENNSSKISVRTVGKSLTDLRNLVLKIVNQSGGEAGGHRNAAGAIIKTKDEAQFIETSKRILTENNMEEVI